MTTQDVLAGRESLAAERRLREVRTALARLSERPLTELDDQTRDALDRAAADFVTAAQAVLTDLRHADRAGQGLPTDAALVDAEERLAWAVAYRAEVPTGPVDERYAAAVVEAKAIDAGPNDPANTISYDGPIPRWIADIAILHSRLEGDESQGGHVCRHLRAGPGVALCFASRPGLRVCRECAADGAIDDVLGDPDAGCDRCGGPGAGCCVRIRFGADILFCRVCVACAANPAGWPTI